MDIHKLADMADKVMEVAMPTVAAISGTCPDHVETTEVHKLREEAARLSDLVASLTIPSRPRSRSSSRSRRPRSPAPTTQPSEDDLCWYHAKFDEAAQKCRDPCSWGNSQASR